MLLHHRRASLDPSSSPSPAPSTPPTHRRKPAGRACDRCRRRKAKCDTVSSDQPCSLCRVSDEPCTFDLPLARRGPKARKKHHTRASSVSVSGTASAQQPYLASSAAAGEPLALADDTLPRRSDGDNASAAQHLIPLGDPASATTSPSNSWEPTGHQGIDVGLSPGTTLVSHPPLALQRWTNLVKALSLRSVAVEAIIEQCFALFFKYLYPLTPLVHEPSLRQGLSFFLGQPATTTTSSSYSTGGHSRLGMQSAQAAAAGWEPFPPSGVNFGPWVDATFTLITAVCAEASFLLPKDIFPEGELVADTFLQASRSCLQSYLELDLEAPNANSLTIRYFHSNCIHASGKPKYSWHIFGEATRLAQVMKLHEESSLDGLYPLEAEMRRRAFWIVYMGDKSAAILNNRPITIHKYSFEEGITIGYPTGVEDPGDSTRALGDSSPSTFIQGFNTNLKLWQAASDLLLEMRLFQDRSMHRQSDASTTPSENATKCHSVALLDDERRRLDQLYVRFITSLDDLPPSLQSYTFAAATALPQQQDTQSTIQCANLQVSLHCLHMIITQKFEDLLPLRRPPSDHADLRKTEIARDMIRVMNEAPFWALQVNGEPYVEKIRLIGATLLEIIHRNGAAEEQQQQQGGAKGVSPLAARARNDLSVLLDLLTRLDSKASDALRSNVSWSV